jgi:hypothetical protein
MYIVLEHDVVFQREALPLGSKGNNIASPPARRIRPPLTYTGTAVAKLAYNAIKGAY